MICYMKLFLDMFILKPRHNNIVHDVVNCYLKYYMCFCSVFVKGCAKLRTQLFVQEKYGTHALVVVVSYLLL